MSNSGTKLHGKNGALYIGGAKGSGGIKVAAKSEWSLQRNRDYIDATVFGDRVYVISTTTYSSEGPSTLRCVNMKTGRVEQSQSFPWRSGPMAADQDHLIIASCHWLHVLDRRFRPLMAFYDGGSNAPILSGRFLVDTGWYWDAHGYDIDRKMVLWELGARRGTVHCLATTRSGRQIVIEYDRAFHVIGIDLQTGRILWKQKMLLNDYDGYLGAGALAAVTGSTAVVPGWSSQNRSGRLGPGGFYAFDCDNGKLVWKFERPEVAGAAVVISKNHVYGLDSMGRLYRFSTRQP